jgi:hypothetical protein
MHHRQASRIASAFTSTGAMLLAEQNRIRDDSL